jgi:hypothetical protein
MTSAGGATRDPALALPILPVSRIHLRRMAGPCGLFQHANGPRPAIEHGSCTDDVARLLALDLDHQAVAASGEILDSIEADLRFLEEAFFPASGRFRNLRSVSGQWLDTAGTQDSHGRAMQALGSAVRRAPRPALRARARALFEVAHAAAAELRAARPLAYVILGCVAAGPSPEAEDPLPLRTARDLGDRLERMVRSGGASWPWPEAIVTYDNGAIAEALIRLGRLLGRDDLTVLGIGCLTWLLDAQITDGMLHPIGNRGWWPRGGAPARFDQQPIEAASLLAAAAAAYEATAEPLWLDTMGLCLGWFLGTNDRHEPLADVPDGSCQDGLGEHDINPNRGAESTLAWLTSVEIVRRVASGIRDASGLVHLPVA